MNGDIMSVFKPLLFLVGALSFASAAHAAPQSWQCDVSHTTRAGWITDIYHFNLGPAPDQAEVIDGVINYFEKDFIPAKVVRDDGETIKLKWEYRAMGASSRRVTMRFDARIDRRAGRFSISAIPLGYDNTESKTGRCTAVKGPLRN